MYSSKYTVLFLTLLHTPQMGSSLPLEEFNKINEVEHFAMSLTTDFKLFEFVAFLGNAASSAISFISTTLEFVEQILLFPGSNESQELLDIKQCFNEINRQFATTAFKYQKLKSRIDWSNIRFPFGKIQMHIKSTEQYFRNIYEGPLSTKMSGKDFFVHSWEADCRNCALNLYNGIMGQSVNPSEEIFDTAMKGLQYDRPATQTFMQYTLSLLMNSIINELAYRKFKYSESDYLYNRHLWEIRFHNVTEKMKSVNSIVMTKYHEQAEKDAVNFARNNPTSVLNNRNFSAKLYEFLTAKYDWRDWLVIVYKPIWGSDGHNNNVCDGYRLYRTYGRNIAISSVDQTKPAMNITKAKEIIDGTSTKYESCSQSSNSCHGSYWSIYCPQKRSCSWNNLDSEGVYGRLPTDTKNCTIYASVGVIDSWVDLYYQGLPERLVHKRTPGSNSYSIHLFG